MADAMRATVASLLRGIDRYNPENLSTLERYVSIQVEENTYDLEANLAILKLYQFNPSHYQVSVTAQILLKALTNLPHTDFVLCKSLLDTGRMDDGTIAKVVDLADLLETCEFRVFWKLIEEEPETVAGVTGFADSIRKYICHVVGTTFQTIDKQTLTEQLGDISDEDLLQWVHKYGWKLQDDGSVFISSQDDTVKTKNIAEKISFESVMDIMSSNLM